MSRQKEFFRRLISKVIVRTRLTVAGRRFHPKAGAIILYGHRVADDDEGYLQGLRPDWFADQVAYLARHYEILSLSTLVSCFESRSAIPRNSVVLTFDDGFRDNLEHVLPVLERFRIPATIFLVSGCISSGELPWSQRLGYLFQRTSLQSMISNALGGRELNLSSPDARRRAYVAVKEKLKPLPHARREQALESIAKALHIEPPRDRMLSWEDVRLMQASGVEFGAHTVSHPCLAEIPYDEALIEMERSREDLRERLAIERPSFCFPAGSSTPDLVNEVPRLGFRSVFLKSHPHRVNSLETTDQFALRRLGLPNAPAYTLEAELDGPLHALRSVYRR